MLSACKQQRFDNKCVSGLLFDKINILCVQKDPVMVQFLRILALCHTVVPDKEDGELCYRAASPGIVY